MGTSKVVPLFLTLVVLAAGCVGFSNTATPEPTTETGPQSGEATPTPLPGVDAEHVVRQVVESNDVVGSYRINGSVSRHLNLPSGDVQASVTTDGAINRSARRLHVAETTSGHMQFVETDSYVANGTLFRRVRTQRTGNDTSWQTAPLSDRDFRLLDPLARQTTLLGNASVTVTNRTTVGGRPAYVVFADVDERAYMQAYDRQLAGQPLNVTALRFRYYTERETGRLLKMTGVLQGEVSQENGSIGLTEKYDMSFAYDTSVSVKIPSNASTAS